MSGYLAGKVWISNLDPELKPLAATLADIGDDDGTSIYPSVAYMAWRLGRSERSVQANLRRLLDLKILVLVREGGGYKKTNEYRLIESSLPQRPSWNERNPATVAPLPEDNRGEVLPNVQRSLQQTSVNQASPNPLDISVSKEPKRFYPPNLQEVSGYMREQGFQEPESTAQKFLDYYEMRGWIPSGQRSQMKSWKAAVRTWKSNSGKFNGGNGNGKYTNQAEQRAEHNAKVLGGFLERQDCKVAGDLFGQLPAAPGAHDR